MNGQCSILPVHSVYLIAQSPNLWRMLIFSDFAMFEKIQIFSSPMRPKLIIYLHKRKGA